MSCCAWKNEGVVLKCRQDQEVIVKDTQSVLLCLETPRLYCSQILYYIHTHYLTDKKVLFMAMTSDPTDMESE